MSPPLFLPLPSTSRSKSFSPTSSFVFEVKKPLVDPELIKSFGFEVSFTFELDKSRNFLICSVSIFADIFLMRSMNPWNCDRLRRGPRLKLQSMGSTSIARKSVSAIRPTCRITARAAIITAGSFVFIAFRRGTTFSCTVYLSRTALLLCLGFFEPTIAPLKSSLASASSSDVVPPQSTTNASRPRTLMPRLLVLLNTAATMGKTSFLIVEKSKTAITIGRQPRALSTIAWVGDSSPSCRIGTTSALNSFPLQLFPMSSKFSKITANPASLAVSRSFPAPRKISRS